MGTYTVERYERGGHYREKKALLAEALSEWKEYFAVHDLGAEYARDAIEHAYDGYEGDDDTSDNLIVIRDKDGKLTGALSYSAEIHERNKFRISRMGVIRRHHGFGTRLVHELAVIAAEQNMGICVYPRQNSDNFYKKIGMKKGSLKRRPRDRVFSPKKTRELAEKKFE